jgi:primosomal protein N'
MSFIILNYFFWCTGSGKTQAYLVPLIAKLSANQALVPPNVITYDYYFMGQ